MSITGREKRKQREREEGEKACVSVEGLHTAIYSVMDCADRNLCIFQRRTGGNLTGRIFYSATY